MRGEGAERLSVIVPALNEAAGIARCLEALAPLRARGHELIVADGTAHGQVKVLTAPGTDRILGVTIAGEHAGDLIAEFVTAMRHGLGLNKILGTIHIYPTYAEANKYAAGAWKKAHAPQRVLAWVERFHAWMRG